MADYQTIRMSAEVYGGRCTFPFQQSENPDDLVENGTVRLGGMLANTPGHLGVCHALTIEWFARHPNDDMARAFLPYGQVDFFRVNDMVRNQVAARSGAVPDEVRGRCGMQLADLPAFDALRVAPVANLAQAIQVVVGQIQFLSHEPVNPYYLYFVMRGPGPVGHVVGVYVGRNAQREEKRNVAFFDANVGEFVFGLQSIQSFGHWLTQYWSPMYDRFAFNSLEILAFDATTWVQPPRTPSPDVSNATLQDW